MGCFDRIRSHPSLKEFLNAPSLSMTYAKPAIAAITWKYMFTDERAVTEMMMQIREEKLRNTKYKMRRLNIMVERQNQ